MGESLAAQVQMDYNLVKTLHGLFRRSPKPLHNMAGPALRVVVDGDSDKVYRKGDRVSGRVILAVEEEERIDSLRIVFAGNCITQTTRPFHVNGGDDSPARREYEEKIRLFDQTKELASATTLERKKYTWTFEFTFPETTDPRYKRLTHGGNYLREPHTLPPTFQLKTNVPGGAAQISYFVQARLSLSGGQGIKRCRQLLPYHPTPANAIQREAKCTSAVLYGQTWKPSHNSKPPKGVFSKVSRRSSLNTPRIIPSILYPESIAPGQHIPISLSVRNSRDALNEGQGECMIDSLSITISTYSTTMCGHSVTQPEDIVSKHVTCIARVDINKPIAFNETKSLTSNFRLVDDAECVPTFKTYTITRRYALGISIGMKYGNEHFTVRSNTPLEILPRVPRDSRSPRYDDTEEYDPLPLYEPREPSKEFAPDYEEIFALSRAPSSVNMLALSRTWSSSASSASDGEAASSIASSVASTPASEIEQVAFEREMMRGT